jgi:predicted glutamine amidotransferase
MCLLIQQTAETNFTEEHLVDFYNRNRDGIGVMWAEGGYLHQDKILPANAAEAVEFYNRVARGKVCCVHYRMRTHGDVDYENTHPYEVFGFTEEHEMPILLMHNGILHTGNDKDTTKSDTWHYIRDYLHRLLDKDPTLAFTPEFKDVIGRHIGSNRFAMMNHLGEVAIINKNQGVMFLGAWLSNTYAWDANRWMPRPATEYAGGHYVSGGKWDNKGWGDTKFPKQKAAKVAKIKNPQMSSGGSKDSAMTPIGGYPPVTASERNVFNGVPIDSKHLDDVLDIRNTLDNAYIGNQTSNRQINAMIDEMGVTKAYFAAELLHEGLLSRKEWNRVSTSRKDMRTFAQVPVEQWYEEKTMDRTTEYFQ